MATSKSQDAKEESALQVGDRLVPGDDFMTRLAWMTWGLVPLLWGQSHYWDSIRVNADETIEYSVSADGARGHHLHVRVRGRHGGAGPEAALPVSGAPTVRVVAWPGRHSAYVVAIAPGAPYVVRLWKVSRGTLVEVWEEETTLDAHYSDSLIRRPAILVGRHEREYASIHLARGTVIYECWTMIAGRITPTRLAVWDHVLRRFKLLPKRWHARPT